MLFHPVCSACVVLTPMELRAFSLPVTPTQRYWFCLAPVVLAGLAVRELVVSRARGRPPACPAITTNHTALAIMNHSESNSETSLLSVFTMKINLRCRMLTCWVRHLRALGAACGSKACTAGWRGSFGSLGPEIFLFILTAMGKDALRIPNSEWNSNVLHFRCFFTETRRGAMCDF